MASSRNRILLCLSIFTLAACSKGESSDPQTVTVTQVQTRTILATRDTNTTAVALEDLKDGAQTLVAGTYSLQCDVTYTTSQSSISQTSGGISYLIRSGLQFAAQSFAAAESGKLTSASVKIFYNSGATNTATLYVYDTLPMGGALGSPLASETLSISGTGEEWVTATFSTPASLQKNTTYYLLLKNSAASDISWLVNTTGNPYAGGMAHVANSGTAFNFANMPTGDMAFTAAIEYKHSPTYQYAWNGVAGTLYTAYPAGQAIVIDGGAAGILKFTPSASAPADDGADILNVVVE